MENVDLSGICLLFRRITLSYKNINKENISEVVKIIQTRDGGGLGPDSSRDGGSGTRPDNRHALKKGPLTFTDELHMCHDRKSCPGDYQYLEGWGLTFGDWEQGMRGGVLNLLSLKRPS